MRDEWTSVDTIPPVQDGELQVWRAEVTAGASVSQRFLRYLSGAEIQRASRLREGLVRDQFVSARVSLRMLLAKNLNLEPHRVPIIPGSHGKPDTPRSNGLRLFYNLAHSRSAIVIGLTSECEIGLDAEYVDRNADVLEISRASFSHNEHRALISVPEDCRKRAFFRYWTRKEAIVKADGRGLSLSLSSFEVPLAEHLTASPISLEPAGTHSAVTYYVSDLPLGEEIAGAFALRQRSIELALFRLPSTAL